MLELLLGAWGEILRSAVVLIFSVFGLVAVRGSYRISVEAIQDIKAKGGLRLKSVMATVPKLVIVWTLTILFVIFLAGLFSGQHWATGVFSNGSYDDDF